MRVSVPEPLRHGGERTGLVIAYGIILAMVAFALADMVFLFTGR